MQTDGQRTILAGGAMGRRGFLQAGAALVLAGRAAAEAAKDLRALVGPVVPWTQSSDRKIRIGVVGGGFGLSWHWHEHPNCTVEAVSDLIPERLEMLKGKYNPKKAYGSLEELVLDPEIDAVAVFTPAPDHARHAILCMEHGKHVISACPACMTLREADQLRAAKRRTGMKYMNAETSHYRWETQLARRLYREGALGEMLYCEAEYYHPLIGAERDRLSFRDGKRTWRYGFPPMLYPTHCTAFLVGVTGERLTKVSCIGLGNPNEPALLDNDYDNPFQNGMAMFQTDQGHPFRCNVAWRIHADGERAQWFGEKGTLYMPGYGGQPFAFKLGSDTLTEVPDLWPLLPEKMRHDTGHGSSHPFITHEFIQALVDEREPEIDLETSLAYCVPGIVAHQSALKGGKQLQIEG